MNPLPRDVGGPGAGADSDERKANDELLQQLLQQSRAASSQQQGHVLPLLEASFQQQSQLNQQLQLLQNNPLVNLQNSLRLAATLNPNLGLLQNQLSAPIPSPLESLVAQQGAYLQQLALPGVSNAATLAGLNQFNAQPVARHPTPEGMDMGALKDSKDEKGKRDPVHAFPSRLHEILAMPEYSEYIAWLPHGRAWKVLNRRMFEKKVIPQHFRHARYASFMRQVNGWGFKRMTEGPDHNAYYHEFFLRDYPQICWKMQRPVDLSSKLGSKKPKKRGKKTGEEGDGSEDAEGGNEEAPPPDLP